MADRVLVVGATGQLGMATVRQLVSEGKCAVCGLVRSEEARAKLEQAGAQALMGDLTQPATLNEACRGATHIVATANAAIPSRRSDTFQSVDKDGYRNLIHAAVAAGVRRFVYASAIPPKSDSPFFRAKRLTEAALQASGLEVVIFRADVFMDVAFAMIGSDIPVRGADNATVMRPFAFARNHFARMRNSIEQKRTAVIPGDGTTRHAFICVDDVARFQVAAVHRGAPGVYTLGGPEAIGFADVLGIYESLLGGPLRISKTPAAIFKVMSIILAPFNPAAANLMHLNYVGATEETLSDPRTWAEFGIQPRTARTFLQERLGRPPA